MSQQLLTEWERRLRINVNAHNLAERRFSWLDNVMGAVALATIVLLGTVATSADLTGGWTTWLVIGVTSVGALCSAFQTQLRLGPTAMAHQAAARQYSMLRRGVEEAKQLPADKMAERVTQLREQWDNLAANVPNVPSRLRARAKEQGAATSGGPTP